MKGLKWFVIILINSLIIFIPLRISRGCGGIDYDESYFNYSFLDQTIINQPDFKVFMYDYWSLYEIENYAFESKEEANINEWKSYFENQPEYDDIKYVVYKVSLEEMEKVKSYVEERKIELDEKLGNNTLIKYWEKNKTTDIIDYLIFAKKCEPHVVWDNYWSPPVRDYDAMQELIDLGGTILNKCRSDFLKLRYGFQIMRLAHYSHQYEFAIEIYDKIIKPLEVESILKDWSLAHKAGSVKKLFREAEAAYIFAKVFDNCPSQRVSSLRSFGIESNNDWEDCLSMCGNVREKTTLYFLRGLDEFSNAVEEMGQIYELDPKSNQLELLLIREVKKVEGELLGNQLKDNSANYDVDHSSSNEYLEELRVFVEKVDKERNTKTPDLWTLSYGYLSLIAEDYENASINFSQLRNSNNINENMKKQLRQLEIVLRIIKLKELNKDTENEIFKEFVDMGVTEHNNLWNIDSRFRFMLDAFANIYREQRDNGKAYLCKNFFSELLYHPRLNILEDLLELEYKKDKSEFEKYLCNSRIGGIEKLLEMKGTILMGMAQLEEAVEIFKKLPSEFRESYERFKVPNDPFIADITDCVYCDDNTNKVYNKLSLAENILKLERLTSSDKDNSAQYYLLIGNAYYNMTYFGKSWMAQAYFRSGSNWGPFTDCSVALSYYKKAIKIAKDKEIAAKATFMAAKCKQNMYYLSDEPKERKWGYILPNYVSYRDHFEKLRDEYSDTRYYEEVISECKYFKYFIN